PNLRIQLSYHLPQQKNINPTHTLEHPPQNEPGKGCGKNIYLLEDERTTEYIDRAEKDGLISTRHIPNKLRKGE
ncbi:hypothetical protein, partial [Bacillus cereus]|uniref:hypothetical protein n=1 Tax=Bacillus cereus TaxID=1396 RepID=UPI0034D41367